MTNEIAARYEANGWRFQVWADGSITPTTFTRDSNGMPTFERYKDAVEAQSYLELSGY